MLFIISLSCEMQNLNLHSAVIITFDRGNPPRIGLPQLQLEFDPLKFCIYISSSFILYCQALKWRFCILFCPISESNTTFRLLTLTIVHIQAWLALMSSSNDLGLTFNFWALSSRLGVMFIEVILQLNPQVLSSEQ